ncbi:MAG TPA: DUF4157 domain-containing protein [Pyrinomonadaceae bacterium]|nr:DUF4157 domain-containing protein [Pyrinomonadaceae bacterium]
MSRSTHNKVSTPSRAATLLPPGSVLQRKCACGTHTVAGGECDSCRTKHEGRVQRSSVGSPNAVEAPSSVRDVLRSPGQPLDPTTRAFMESRFAHDFSRVRVRPSEGGILQPRLTVNEPGDRYEQEADRVAERVMSLTAQRPPRAGEVEPRARVLGPPEGAQTAAPESSPSPAGERSSAGPRPTAPDFGHVRVHTGGRAAESARELNAAAYTVGRDVVFGEGQYAPGTSAGRNLLAHELAHVIQQTAGGPQVQCRTLTSPRLAGNRRFQRVLDNRAVLEIGDSGPEVRRLQQLLIDLGLGLSAHGADGIYGNETADAVKEFQRRNGLTDDGRVGFATIDALDRAFPAVTLPATRSAPWTMSCVLSILCPWNRHLVEHVLPTFHIITFDSRSFPTETFDGASWNPGTFHSGGFRSGTNMGFLNTTTCEQMAFTIYHEGWHGQQPASLSGVVESERDAYVNAEQWSISMGVPGQTFRDASAGGAVRGLRTTRGGETVVDEPAAERLVRQDYGGVSTTPGERILRRVGATNVEVLRPDGTRVTRPARPGESVRGAVAMTNMHPIAPASWRCP